MSLDSRADVIPYTRFLEVRLRRQEIAAAIGTPLLPPAVVIIQPESPGTTIDGERVTGATCP
jgi:hypothetical protein